MEFRHLFPEETASTDKGGMSCFLKSNGYRMKENFFVQMLQQITHCIADHFSIDSLALARLDALENKVVDPDFSSSPP